MWGNTAEIKKKKKTKKVDSKHRRKDQNEKEILKETKIRQQVTSMSREMLRERSSPGSVGASIPLQIK